MSPATKRAPEAEEAKGSGVEERLRSRLRAQAGEEDARDRAENPAIPFNALYIQDFPTTLDYDWVPAPGGLGPAMHSAPEMANRRAEYVQKGWQFYPAEEFADHPDAGVPWMSVWENDNGKVRALDHWLMYIDKDAEERKRAFNTDRWNKRRAQKRESENAPDDSNRTRAIVESERGQVRLVDLLGEDKE